MLEKYDGLDAQLLEMQRMIMDLLQHAPEDINQNNNRLYGMVYCAQAYMGTLRKVLENIREYVCCVQAAETQWRGQDV